MATGPSPVPRVDGGEDGWIWSAPISAVFAQLQTSDIGLSAEEALLRLQHLGPNQLTTGRQPRGLALVFRQFTSPIILILVGAALLSFALDSFTDGAIILVIVVISGLLGFWQERGAAQAIDQLLAVVDLRCRVLRDGQDVLISRAQIVPGDVVLLAAGAGIPADCRLLEERDLSVDEASLTGESFPVGKQVATVAAQAPMAERCNVLWMGSHVVSGNGRAVVVHTGRHTAYGAMADALHHRRPVTEFERGVRRFGAMLMELTLLLIALIFAFNVFLERPVIDSFLFSLALGVGLTPQLLPAIISVNLAYGARRMAHRRVVVKRLEAIENFGSMDVLCTDKTGTITEGSCHVFQALAADGQESSKVLQYAWLNAMFESGYPNPIDDGLRQLTPEQLSPDGPCRTDNWRKLDEQPFDFHRKRLSLLLQSQGEHDSCPVLITKGATHHILEICDTAEQSDGTLVDISLLKDEIEALCDRLSSEGYRLLAVAKRPHAASMINGQSEQAMTWLGVLVLRDPLKADIPATIQDLEALGVRLKIMTGDNALVASRVGREAGIDAPVVMTGPELLNVSDGALPIRVQQVDIFAEVEPNQKQRLILALRRAGHVVGYMGDGINDAPALHAADVGLSVQGAVDVAKEAADIVLLDHDLAVLCAGIREGRRTFANTLKYVFMATSANFGNMASMAVASLALPFLPLLPKQILLTNLLTDLPEMAIAADHVDAAWINHPRRWDLGFIKRFMLTFGLVSSLFDGLTFVVLLWGLNSDANLFRTGWFVESVVSAASIVLVVRTQRPLMASRPGGSLVVATVVVVVVTLLLPYTSAGRLFGFVPLPFYFLPLLGGILLTYVVVAEIVKRWFYNGRTTVSSRRKHPQGPVSKARP